MFPPALAQRTSEITSSTLEWDLPYLWSDWVPLGLLILAAVAASLFTWRDVRFLSPVAAIFLMGLRIVFLAVGLVIALNPHERTQTDAFRDSRVILLVDTSQSMQQPESDPRLASGEEPATREEAARTLLAKSPLVDRLRERHTVEVYSFGSDLSELLLRLPRRRGTANSETSDSVPTTPSEESVDWDSLLEPTGLSTRLGDSLDTLLVESQSPTLSGVVLLSDGASNSGRDLSVPRERAKEQGVRLVAVGIGSTQPPVNLEVSRLIAPTDVQKGDAFELSALIRGTGLAGETIQVDLLQQGPSDPEPKVVYSESQTLAEDGAVREVQFDLNPSDAGKYEFIVRANLPGGIETRGDDNQLGRSVNIFDRPLRVLVMAGGPLRDYRFARTILYRHPSVQLDVWLQSGSVGISQEADKLLYRFPETVEEFYQYDVLMAFDPDWSQLTEEQREMLLKWVSNEGGGLVLLAGDVYTPRLASDPELESIRKLYPVLLEEVSLRLGDWESTQTAFPLTFSQEGSTAEFLKLTETGDAPAWDEFAGIFRTYPTRGTKAGATVYAEFSDPLARGRGGQPVIIAGQRYGQGQVLYFGSPELWRLRELDPAYLDRLWVKLARKAAEGRSKRGLQRGMFLLDGYEFLLGQTVPIRARALNPQFQPLMTDQLTLDVFGPGGAPVVPGPQLRQDPVRPAEFVGDFRPLQPGRYRLEFILPDTSERVGAEIDVQLPRQEAASLVQEAGQLQRLVEGTGGDYVTLSKAASVIPELLPDKGESVIIDQRTRELWDRQWLMFLLVGLLSLEWLTRKLMKLA